MKHLELTFITILLLAFSFNGIAQNKVLLKELHPTVSEPDPVKIEVVDGREVLIVSSTSGTFYLVYDEQVKESLKSLFDAKAGKTVTLKDIDGNNVTAMRVERNQKPGIYFKNQKKKTISIYIDDIKELLADR